MLSMLPKETYTLEEFQKTLGELAEKIPERTAECTAIKRRFLNLAKATVVWDYLDAKVLQKSHPAIQTFSLKEYQKLIYDLAMTIQSFSRTASSSPASPICTWRKSRLSTST